MTALLAEVPQLETDRLVLRGWDEADFEMMRLIFTHAETMRFLGGPTNDYAAWRALAGQIGHWAMRGYGFFAVEEKGSGNCIGWCGPWFPYGWPDREIGWTLCPDYRGQGYATEAAQASLVFAYRVLGWDTAISLIDEHNHASIAVAERLGATREKRVTVQDFDADIYRHLPPDQFLSRMAS